MQLNRQVRHVQGMTEAGPVEHREIANRGRPDVGHERRPANEEAPLEEHALAQPRSSVGVV